MRKLIYNGESYEITGENERYYLCSGTSFRKGNPEIKIEEVKEKAEKKSAKKKEGE